VAKEAGAGGGKEQGPSQTATKPPADKDGDKGRE